MKYVLRNVIVGLTLLGCFSAQAGGAVKISAQVDSSKDIYIGENFTYYIIIEGAEKAGQVDVTGLLQYNPQHTGNRQQSSTKIINNRVTTTKNIIMTYSLTAGSAGRINLPPVDVTLSSTPSKNAKGPRSFILPDTSNVASGEFSPIPTLPS